MTLPQLYLWHREQAERYADRAKDHKTNAAQVYREAVTRRYEKQSEFHARAATLLRPFIGINLDSCPHGYTGNWSDDCPDCRH